MQSPWQGDLIVNVGGVFKDKLSVKISQNPAAVKLPFVKAVDPIQIIQFMTVNPVSSTHHISRGSNSDYPIYDSKSCVKYTPHQNQNLEPTNFNNNINMLDTTTDSCGSQWQLFNTRYSYGSRDQEFVFCCRGRPFAALVSPNLPTPTSSLLDFDLVKTLGLKITDLQCKKFYFAGNKMRILGRVSTTVQCIQNGRTVYNKVYIIHSVEHRVQHA